MARRALVIGLLILIPNLSQADKVIMKDGKIYEGRIMGENSRSLLISNMPLDPKPHFIEMKDVLTIVRESHPPETISLDTQRFVSVHAGITGKVYSHKVFS